MSHPGCSHLHVHSEYSLLDGACKIDALAARAAAFDQPALGLTDHGVMNGAVELQEACRKHGVKPIVGCEVYFVDDHRHRGREERNHLTLLAASGEGYRNLVKLSSLGFTSGLNQGKPRVDLELLAGHAEGVIALTGCLASRFCSRITEGRLDDARAHADDLLQVFGAEQVYFEVQKNGLAEQDRANEGVVRIARELGRPLVGTADVHYLRKEDYHHHAAMLCVGTKSTLQEPKLTFDTNEFFLKDSGEMAAAFAEWPDALPTTLEIAERCDVEIELGRQRIPRFDCPDGLDEPAYLRRLVEAGLRERYGDPVPAAAVERAEMELGVIERMGFCGYFLIVQDFVGYAKGQGIPVGPGRGSAAGSIVAYVLRITDLDPLRYGLLFERFLNPDRISMPDIDIDFSVEGRDRVIRYVTEKYGRESVAQIATFGKMLPRNATRDAARVLGHDYAVGDRLAKLVPEPIMGKTPPLEECMAPGTELRKAYDEDPVARSVLDVAQGLEGIVRNVGIHAAAVVIAPEPLTEIVPVQMVDARTTDAEGNKVFRVVTQFAMGPVEDLGLLKMDFLGLRNLDVIEDTVRIIERSTGERLDVEALPLDDAKTYEMLARGDSIGVFQFESEGMRKALVQVRPTEFDDLVALVALYRPGAMDQIPTYARGKRDPEAITYLDDRLRPVLESTKGVILYQEQAMEIAKQLGGFSAGMADDLRKAIGKKKMDKMAQLEAPFRQGCEERGVARQAVDWIWEVFKASANYSFNKSHAACYALISYRTAWLKANHPAEYMAALISSVMSTKDKVPFFVAQCEEMGIEILPPDVNESDHEFVVTEGNIRFGLEAVKGVGHQAIEAMKRVREEDGPFTSLWDFCERVDGRCVNKKCIEALVKAGAFDALPGSRKGMMDVLEAAQAAGAKAQQDAEIGQGSIFDLGPPAGGTGAAPAFAAPSHPPISTDEWDATTLLGFEKEALGLFISDHPLKRVREALRAQTDQPLSNLGEVPDGTWVTVGGIVTTSRRIRTRSGSQMLIAALDDLEGHCELLAFERLLETCGDLLEADQVVLVRGVVDHKESGSVVKAQEVKPFAPTEDEIAAAKAVAAVAATGPPPLRLRLDARALPATIVEDLVEVLQAVPGKAEVVLELETTAGCRRLRLGENFRVAPCASLHADLERLLGPALLPPVEVACPDEDGVEVTVTATAGTP